MVWVIRSFHFEKGALVFGSSSLISVFSHFCLAMHSVGLFFFSSIR